MKTQFQHRNATSSRRLTSIAVVAMGASAVLALIPTRASAFDLGGMIGTAMAMQMQMGAFGFHGGAYGHSRSRGSPHNDSDNTAGNGSAGGGEHDARDDATMERPSKVATRQSFGSSGAIRQASERDASAGQTGGSDRVADDAPAYRPSR
jgi:hypothetical protein